MSKAIALVRVSTKAQELDSQREQVIQAILKDGYDESDIICVEDVESASKLNEEERSGLNKMKRCIETEQVSSVYVYEISRISRKESILYSIRDYLQRHQVQLVCLVPSFVMFNPDWSISDQAAFTFSIFSTLSSQETRIRTARMMRGKEKKKSEGKLSVGSPIFGYEVDDEHYIIPHKKNAPIVREIFERYAALESASSIGKDLYYRGALANKSSKMVTVQSYVCAILKEKRYARIDEDSIYPALISKELFNRVKDIRENKPSYFIRKSKTKEVYPLQGFLYTVDGYKLTPSITNNRYLKMNGVTHALSLNMKHTDSLTMLVMNKYLSSRRGIVDTEKERLALSEELNQKRAIIDSSRVKIESLYKENDLINSRIIKGRLSEAKGDAMIDENYKQMRLLEDAIQDAEYRITVIDNRLLVLSNPLLAEDSEETVSTLEELKEVCYKYLEKVIITKVKFSTYSLEYHFLDGYTCTYGFYSINRGVKFYDSEWNIISSN